MMHLLAFNGSVAASQTDLQMAAVADQEFSRQNSSFEIREALNIYAMYASGIGVTRARVNTASLRLRGFPQIYPTSRLLLPPVDPDMYDLRTMPLPLRAQEDFRIDVSTDATGGPNQSYVFAWVGRPGESMGIPTEGLRWVRTTAAVTTIAQAWSGLATIVFDDPQESTRYEVWGMQCVETNTLAARLQFQGQPYRPGCLANATVGLRSHEMFRGEHGMGLGFYGYYDTYAAPQLETLANTAAATTPEVYLLVRKAA